VTTWLARRLIWLTVAGVFAWFAAVAAGAYGAYLGWQSSPALPTDAEATHMVQPAFVPGTSAQPQRWDLIFDQSPTWTDPRWVSDVLGVEEYVRGQVFFEFALPNEQPATNVVLSARERMQAAGWLLVEQDLSGCCPLTTLHRDGWLVEVASDGYLDDSHYAFRVALSRAAPEQVRQLAAIGLLSGGLAGVLLAVVAMWLYRRRWLASAWQFVPAASLALGFAAAFPATALSSLALVATYVMPQDPLQAPAWAGYTLFFFRPLAGIGFTCVLLGLVLLAAGRGTAKHQPASST
jgi:hypothetical protein